LLVSLSFSLTIPPSLLQFAFELRALLVDVMEEERSPILDVVGDVSKVPLSVVSMTPREEWLVMMLKLKLKIP
jgi:hypothetical protein